MISRPCSEPANEDPGTHRRTRIPLHEAALDPGVTRAGSSAARTGEGESGGDGEALAFDEGGGDSEGEGEALTFDDGADAFVWFPVEAAPGAWRLRLGASHAVWRLVVRFADGRQVPLPLTPADAPPEACVHLHAPANAIGVAPAAGGPARLAFLKLAPLDPEPRALAPRALDPRADVQAGEHACAHVRQPMGPLTLLRPLPAAPVPPTPADWQPGLSLSAACGVRAGADGAWKVATGGFVAVAAPFRGPVVVSARLMLPDGTPALVAPAVEAQGVRRLLVDCGGSEGAGDCGGSEGGGIWRAALLLGDDGLRLYPRRYAGPVCVHALTVRRVSPLVLPALRALWWWQTRGTRLPGAPFSLRLRLFDALSRPFPALGARLSRRRRWQHRPAPPEPPAGRATRRPLAPAATAGEGAVPSVTIITATRDAPALLRPFLASLRATRAPFELILVDHMTREPAALALLAEARAAGHTVLSDTRAFNFAALNNRAAARARGTVLVFANNDLTFCDPCWLGPLALAAAAPGIGCAGARLLYPGGRIQHAGLVLAGESGPKHLHRFLAGNDPGPQGRLTHTHAVSAVSAALMAITRERFEALGGFDPAFPVRYNDIDLNLRAARAGLTNVLVPQAVAIHHESASLARLRPRRPDPVREVNRAAERAVFHERWGDVLQSDPHYPRELEPRSASFWPRAEKHSARQPRAEDDGARSRRAEDDGARPRRAEDDGARPRRAEDDGARPRRAEEESAQSPREGNGAQLRREDKKEGP